MEVGITFQARYRTKPKKQQIPIKTGQRTWKASIVQRRHRVLCRILYLSSVPYIILSSTGFAFKGRQECVKIVLHFSFRKQNESRKKLNLKQRTEREHRISLPLSRSFSLCFLPVFYTFSDVFGYVWWERRHGRCLIEIGSCAARWQRCYFGPEWIARANKFTEKQKIMFNKNRNHESSKTYLCLRIFWFLPSKEVGVPAPEVLDEGGLYGRGQPWTTGGDDIGAYCNRGLDGTPGCINLMSPVAFKSNLTTV